MDAVLPSDTDRIEAGRQLGHDYYRFTRYDANPNWEASVLEGFYQADGRRLQRQTGDRFVRKWLQVRCNAIRRERIVDRLVTPSFLQQLDVATCPILRFPLTHGGQAGSDWSVDRLNNEGAYAPGNLAVVSTQANKAKDNHTFDEVYERALARESVAGLSSREWMRMASLMLGPCFATAPGTAPIIPLLTPLPVSTVRSATQIIQYALTLRTRSNADKNLVIKQFTRLCSDSHARTHVHQIVELIHVALKTIAVDWDVWDSPRIMRSFLSLRASVSSYVWAALGDEAAILAGGRHVPQRSLGAWHLRTAGHFSETWRR